MILTNENKLLGSTILNLLEEISNKKDNDIFYSLSRGESKSSFYLKFIDQKFNSKFSLLKKTKNKFKIGIYIKFSNSRRSPWRYTFKRQHQEEINKMYHECKKIYVLLIAGNDGVVLLTYENLKKLLDENFLETEWLSVNRKYKQYFRVDGQDSKSKIRIPKSDFPQLIVDQINKFESL